MLIIRQLKSVFNTSNIITQKRDFVNRILQKSQRKSKFLYILAKCSEMIIATLPIDKPLCGKSKSKNCAKCSKKIRYFAQKDYLQISFYVIK